METLEFIGWICLAAFVGFWWGSKITATLHRAAAHMLLEELKITPQQLKRIQEDLERRISTIDEGEEHKEILDVRLEQRQGVIFAYRSDDGLFLGQGTNQDDLVKSVSARLSNCTVRIAADQGADLLLKNNTQNG
jgi:hypothetical protein